MGIKTSAVKRKMSGGMPVASHSRGFVLITTLVLLLSMTVLAATVAYRTVLDEYMAANQRDGIKAMVIAENGIDAGYALIEKDYVTSLSFYPGLFDLNGPFISGESPEGYYVVNVTRDITSTGEELAVMTSVGSANGAKREIEVVLQMKRPFAAPLTAPKELKVTAWRELIR